MGGKGGARSGRGEEKPPTPQGSEKRMERAVPAPLNALHLEHPSRSHPGSLAPGLSEQSHYQFLPPNQSPSPTNHACQELQDPEVPFST